MFGPYSSENVLLYLELTRNLAIWYGSRLMKICWFLYPYEIIKISMCFERKLWYARNKIPWLDPEITICFVRNYFSLVELVKGNILFQSFIDKLFSCNEGRQLILNSCAHINSGSCYCSWQRWKTWHTTLGWVVEDGRRMFRTLFPSQTFFFSKSFGQSFAHTTGGVS